MNSIEPTGLVRCILRRSAVCALGGIGLGWGVFMFPLFWVEAGANHVARQIIRGHVYKSEMLEVVAAELEKPSYFPKGAIPLRTLAILHLQMAEQAIDLGQRDKIDQKLADSDSAVRAALEMSPTDSFLWLMLFWLQNTREGFTPDRLAILRMSYDTGPNEGWIALKRNRIALALFRQLPSDLAARTAAEFAQLVGAGFIREAADLLSGPGWPVRDFLLPTLKEVDLARREQIERLLYSRGYDVSIPGVEVRDARPWQ